MARRTEGRCCTLWPRRGARTSAPAVGTATATTTGVSEINTEILALWTAGQQNLLDGECAEAEALIGQMASLMAVPLIQGVLR